MPAGNPTGPSLVDLGTQAGLQVTWLVNIAGGQWFHARYNIFHWLHAWIGTTVYLSLHDTTGAGVLSSPFTILSSRQYQLVHSFFFYSWLSPYTSEYHLSNRRHRLVQSSDNQHRYHHFLDACHCDHATIIDPGLRWYLQSRSQWLPYCDDDFGPRWNCGVVGYSLLHLASSSLAWARTWQM